MGVDVSHHAADVAVPIGDQNASEGHGQKARSVVKLIKRVIATSA